MQFEALLLTPQRRLSHVVCPTLVASAGPLPILRQIRCSSATRPNLYSSTTYQFITSRAYAAPSKILRDIKNHTQAHPVSIFHSNSDNPYHNLAIENYILKNSDPQSKILLFYTNRPCVVIGRNQNPWLECNIAGIQDGLPNHDVNADVGKIKKSDLQATARPSAPLDLVRRRSGGGTVIHDIGNLNFSFLVPNDKDFGRDKHGELVVQALQTIRTKKEFAGNGLFESVRVNERHDIVIVREGDSSGKEFKVSGSAFKLTRGRALHHGTILHSSPNVNRQIPISQDGGIPIMTGVFSALLSSPAKPYLEAKGVGSVRSPVHNLFQLPSQQQRHNLVEVLRKEIGTLFLGRYDAKDIAIERVGDNDCIRENNEDIYKDVRELMTDNWRYCQTPTFEYNSHRSGGSLDVQFQVKHGIVKNAVIHLDGKSSEEFQSRFSQLEEKKLHEIQSWAQYLPPAEETTSEDVLPHLDTVFPKIILAGPDHREGLSSETTEQTRIVDGKSFTRQHGKGHRTEVEKKGENVIVKYQSRHRSHQSGG